MSQYLRIASKGEAQVESFTVLGASSARGESDKIGQFGSGAKHAVLCALRAGIGLLVYCGRVKIVPQTQPQTIHGKVQERVVFRIDNRTEVSSMTLDFGSLDWTQPVTMMLRELISNALDSADGVWGDIVIEYVDTPRAKSGWTQVFVELTNEVREYVAQLDKFFLHVGENAGQTCIPQEPGPCRFYRKGVFVHEVAKHKALFSYNCGDDLPIDESRNLDSYRVACHAAKLLTKSVDNTRTALRSIVAGETVYEGTFSTWYLQGATVATALREEYGENVCIASNTVSYSRAVGKGLNCVMIPKESWYDAAISGGVTSATSLLSKADNQGLSVYPASEELVNNALMIWDCLESLGLTGTLTFPGLMEFEKPVNAGGNLGGFWCDMDKTVYIHRDHVGNWATIIEEFAHYVTDANDETRDFQDYAFRLAGLCMKKLLTGQC